MVLVLRQGYDFYLDWHALFTSHPSTWIWSDCLDQQGKLSLALLSSSTNTNTTSTPMLDRIGIVVASLILLGADGFSTHMLSQRWVLLPQLDWLHSWDWVVGHTIYGEARHRFNINQDRVQSLRLPIGRTGRCNWSAICRILPSAASSFEHLPYSPPRPRNAVTLQASPLNINRSISGLQTSLAKNHGNSWSPSAQKTSKSKIARKVRTWMFCTISVSRTTCSNHFIAS